MLIWIGEFVSHAASQSLCWDSRYNFNIIDLQLHLLLFKIWIKAQVNRLWVVSSSPLRKADPYDQTPSQFGKTLIFSQEIPKTGNSKDIGGQSWGGLPECRWEKFVQNLLSLSPALKSCPSCFLFIEMKNYENFHWGFRGKYKNKIKMSKSSRNVSKWKSRQYCIFVQWWPCWYCSSLLLSLLARVMVRGLCRH